MTDYLKNRRMSLEDQIAKKSENNIKIIGIIRKTQLASQ
jgi:hypothetical protein